MYKDVDSGKFVQILGIAFNDCILCRTHCKALLGESEKTEFIIHGLTFSGRERNSLGTSEKKEKQHRKQQLQVLWSG